MGAATSPAAPGAAPVANDGSTAAPGAASAPGRGAAGVLGVRGVLGVLALGRGLLAVAPWCAPVVVPAAARDDRRRLLCAIMFTFSLGPVCPDAAVHRRFRAPRPPLRVS